MPEYVYALHDFQPEHEDEVPFLAGEQIEIVEKDDLYGDGWWQASPVHYYIYHVAANFCRHLHSMFKPLSLCRSALTYKSSHRAEILRVRLGCFLKAIPPLSLQKAKLPPSLLPPRQTPPSLTLVLAPLSSL